MPAAPRAEPERASVAAPPAVRVEVSGAPARGPADALVTIVEFLDYECAYCAYAHPTIESLLRRYPRDVRWVVKHNPLGFHARAVPAALIAIEARAQQGDAAFFAATDLLLSSERLDAARLSEIVQQLALEPQGLARAFALGSEHPVLVADQDQALELDVRGTPNFFINGVRLSGARPYAEFERVVQAALERGKAELARGVPRAEVYAALQRAARPPPALERGPVPEVTLAMPSFGPADATVTVQVFSDFECPFCARVMPTLDELCQRYPNDVRVVWRHLPLPFHRRALPAAKAAEEARVQAGDDAFWQLARRMLGTPSAPPEVLDRATLLRFGSELGLAEGPLALALDDARHEPAIARDIASARESGIDATPGFVINGYRLVGAHPLRRFDRLVRLALSEAAGRRPPPFAQGSSTGAPSASELDGTRLMGPSSDP